MTKETLERAKEIQFEIEDLKRSLSQLSRGKLFDIDSNSCSISRQGAPFLAQIESELRTLGTDRVLERISKLEEEFNGL